MLRSLPGDVKGHADKSSRVPSRKGRQQICSKEMLNISFVLILACGVPVIVLPPGSKLVGSAQQAQRLSYTSGKESL